MEYKNQKTRFEILDPETKLKVDNIEVIAPFFYQVGCIVPIMNFSKKHYYEIIHQGELELHENEESVQKYYCIPYRQEFAMEISINGQTPKKETLVLLSPITKYQPLIFENTSYNNGGIVTNIQTKLPTIKFGGDITVTTTRKGVEGDIITDTYTY